MGDDWKMAVLRMKDKDARYRFLCKFRETVASSSRTLEAKQEFARPLKRARVVGPLGPVPPEPKAGLARSHLWR
eukprot:2227854-Lingulodinium_polyedra.AAC.1